MKTCPKCGQRMAVLFQVELYCPRCDGDDAPKDPWDIEFKHSGACQHPPDRSYVYDDKVWCRACGDLLGERE